MQNINLSISVVVPTLNRADYISKLIKSIVGQSLLPDQLIVVDQNTDDATKNTVTNIINSYPEIKLTYIHDSSFNSLVQAKEIGTKNAIGDIVCFLDDEVILHEEYIANIKSGFQQKQADMLGCMGYITNETKKSRLFLLMRKLFLQGIFADKRPEILSNINDSSDTLILSNVLSGGASSWRREVFDNIAFDVTNNLHYHEDMDYSERAIKYYGSKFYVNTKAKMQDIAVHNNKPNHFNIQKLIIIDAFIYYKKRINYPWAIKDMFLLLLWRIIRSLVILVKYRTFSPVHGYLSGVSNGIFTKVRK